MTDSFSQKDENIVIRTMKDDLEKLSGIIKEPEKESESVPVSHVFSVPQEKKEATIELPLMPPQKITTPTPTPTPPIPAPLPPLTILPIMPPKPEIKLKPPVLIIPQKTIPPKEIAEIPTKPLLKATPIWFKIGSIGIGIFLIVIAGLYGYWKIFIQNAKPPIIIVPPKIATTTLPMLPIAPIATTTAPIKFFNGLPNKEVTIDISSKTPDALIKAVKSEAAVAEPRASIKQIKITYRGKLIATEEFFNLMSIFTPKDFLSNYKDEFALAFFSQKEGIRPILILRAKNKALMEDQMENWEIGTLPSDILPLFLANFKLPSRLPSFKSYLFIGQPVHYLNINMPFASLNYAIYNDSLIFTTSSAGMFIILQDLTGKKASLDYQKSLEASIGDFAR